MNLLEVRLHPIWLGLLALLALGACTRSSGDACRSSGPGCVCSLVEDGSEAPECRAGSTPLEEACVCFEEPADEGDAGVGCLSDLECPAGRLCDPQRGMCFVPGAGCGSDDDCDAGEVCDVARGVCGPAPGGCGSDAECPDDQICDVARGVCGPAAEGCGSDAECPGDQTCDVATGACLAPVEPSCEDGAHNQDETDVDCGGGCAPCQVGLQCATEDDCIEGASCTAGQCDLPPRVRSQMPRAGEDGVAVDAAIVVEFSDAIDPASIDRTSFIVSVEGESAARPWDAAVAGRYAVEGRTVTFTPDAPLQALNTRYQVRLCPEGACPQTVRDREGNALIDEGTTWTFTTRPVAVGQVFLANTRDTGGRDRVSFGDGRNALVGRDQQRWIRWQMRHLSGNRYTFRGVDVNLELSVARGPGGTHDRGAGATAWRNGELTNGGTVFQITPTGSLNDGTPYFTISTEDGFALQLACPGGFCDPANLQAQQGGSADAWFILP